MKIFLSWSGEVSQGVASALHRWLPYIIQSVKPFLSSVDISKGARWNDALAKELEDADYGIVCVTPYNIDKVWMNFEAGALSKRFDRAHLIPFLFRMDRSEITGPLAQFQSTLCNDNDILEMLYSINNSLGDSQLDHVVLRDTFREWWPSLKKQLDEIPPAAWGETRTSYPWLYTTEDLAIHELGQTKCIWIISPDTKLLNGQFKQTVFQNLQKGIAYRFFLPDRGAVDEGEKADLDELVGDSKVSQGNLTYNLIDQTKFDRSAATDYVIINPEINVVAETSYKRRMFLRLPIPRLEQSTGSAQDRSMDYWIEVDEQLIGQFKTRFGALLENSKASAATS
jgi:hypothetical protein